MKIAAWNVNSDLKVRLPHLLDWLAEATPDVLCLQELKLEDHNFPRAEIEAAGYHVAFSGQKTYNGVRCWPNHRSNRCRLRQSAVSGRTEAPDFRHH
jgi:exonuclease III